jgi:hypothetical protein
MAPEHDAVIRVIAIHHAADVRLGLAVVRGAVRCEFLPDPLLTFERLVRGRT